MTKKKTSDETPADKNDQADLGELASQYVDLWQQQLSGAASDEALAGVMAQTVQLMNAGAVAMASYSSLNPVSAETSDRDHNGGTKHGGNAGEHSGASTVTAPSGADNAVIDELHRRIEQLEERIATLEAGTGGKRT